MSDTIPDAPAPSETNSHVHPLVNAAKWLLADLLSTLAFVLLYAATHSIPIATGLAIALGLGQIGYLHFRGRPIDLMQWLSLFLVVVFGTAALFTGNPTFIKLKPTLIYVAVGAVMLKPGWMNHYLPPIASEYAADVTWTFGFIWAALMFGTGAVNLALASLASPAIWAWFVGAFPIVSKIVLAGIHYDVTRRIVRRRIRASRQPVAVIA